MKPDTRFLMPLLKSVGYHVISFGKVAHGRDKWEWCEFNSPRRRNLFDNVREYLAELETNQPTCLLVGDRRPPVSWTKERDYDPQQVSLPSYFIDTPETREHWARYLTDITGMDLEMGLVYDLVKDRLGENCIFLFTSDHGGQWPREKWNLYDSGIRVPLIVSWPGVIPSGVRTDAMVSWVDIVPTLIDLAGGEIGFDPDGKSFVDVLTKGKPTHRDLIFTTHTGDGKMNIFPIRSVRSDSYRYIVNLRPDAWHTNHSDRHRKDGAGAFWNSWDRAAKTDPKAAAIVKAYYTRPPEEFFDLEQDPLELTNLATDTDFHPLINRLKNELTEWTNAQGDDLQPHKEPYPNSKPLPDLN